MEEVKNNKLKEEFEIEQAIKNGTDMEITEAIEILSMLKNNISIEEISHKTGKSISDIQNIKTIFNA